MFHNAYKYIHSSGFKCKYAAYVMLVLSSHFVLHVSRYNKLQKQKQNILVHLIAVSSCIAVVELEHYIEELWPPYSEVSVMINVQ